MSVRSKGRVNRTFDVLNEIEFAAEEATEGKVREINASISRFQAELNNLGRQANAGNIALLQNEGVQKKETVGQKDRGSKRTARGKSGRDEKR